MKMALVVLALCGTHGIVWMHGFMTAEDRTNRKWVWWAKARHELSKIVTGAD